MGAEEQSQSGKASQLLQSVGVSIDYLGRKILFLICLKRVFLVINPRLLVYRGHHLQLHHSVQVQNSAKMVVPATD